VHLLTTIVLVRQSNQKKQFKMEFFSINET